MPLDLPALHARRDTFNLACPPGATVRARMPTGDITTTTRAAAALMGSGEVVVWLTDIEGAVSTDRVTPLPPTQTGAA